MKNLNLLLFLLVSLKIYSQSNSEYSIINIYNNNTRDGVVATVYIDNKEIATVKPKSLLKYKVSNSGEHVIKVKTVYLFKGQEYPVGKPVDKTLNTEKGKVYYVSTKAKGMGGVSLSIANDKEIEKLKKLKINEILEK